MKKPLSDEHKAKLLAARKLAPSFEEKIKINMNKDYRTDPPLIRSKAIKEKCMNCCGWQRSEVVACTSYSCPLWPYRVTKATKKTEPPLTETKE